MLDGRGFVVRKMIAVRIDRETAAQVEKVRDAARFPTQSDFIREAIRRMIREERRRRVAAEIDRLLQNADDVQLAQAFAEENALDLSERWDAIERSER
jgi:Arc/MetJ-type ribon-helix-helix transcriptional regulator